MKGISFIKPVFLLLIVFGFILFVSSLNFTDTAKFILYLIVFIFLMLFVVWFLTKKSKSDEVDMTFQSY
jgi:ABC-type multidrug transport system permease subunit